MAEDDSLRGILVEQVDRLLADKGGPDVLRAAERGEWPEALWAEAEALGLPLALAPEAMGGAGLGWEDAAAVWQALGRHGRRRVRRVDPRAAVREDLALEHVQERRGGFACGRGAPSPGAEARAALDALRRLVRALRASARVARRDHQVSAAQLFALRAVAAEPGLSLGALAARTHTSQSSCSEVAARLADRGLVERRPERADAALALGARASRGTRSSSWKLTP